MRPLCIGATASFVLSAALIMNVAQGRSDSPLPATLGAGDQRTPSEPQRLRDEELRTLYALGVLINRNLDDFDLTPEEFERVKSGLNDGFEHRASQVDLSIDTATVQALRRARMARSVDNRVKAGQAFLDQAAALPGSVQTRSGMVVIKLKAGRGVAPTAEDSVLVRYRGKLIDGTLFDSASSEPAKFALNAVIPCWTEALPLMKVGEKSRIVCPPNLAYGLRGAPPKIPTQSTLDFEVELVAIAPRIVAATPAAMPPGVAPASPNRP